ncbi:hypothetical protein D1007_11245 [Hordeum vulgare]|nr:hypothetical protein D1007_11245 [Hordeum vulgare]
MTNHLGEIKKNEALLTDEEYGSPKKSSSTSFVHMCLMARGNDELSSSLSDNDDICNDDDDDELTENIYVIGKILHRAKNNAYKRFQYVLSYFEKCNESLMYEQAKGEQLEHELDKVHQTCRDLRSSKGEIEIAHGKLKEDFVLLLPECNNVKGELIKTSKIYEELQSTHEKSLIAIYSSHIVDDTCASNSTSFEASTLKENVELCSQLDLLTNNYGKLEESHENLVSTHEDLLISHNELKLALKTMAIKVKSCESYVDISTSTINALLPCANPSTADSKQQNGAAAQHQRQLTATISNTNQQQHLVKSSRAPAGNKGGAAGYHHGGDGTRTAGKTGEAEAADGEHGERRTGRRSRRRGDSAGRPGGEAEGQLRPARSEAEGPWLPAS